MISLKPTLVARYADIAGLLFKYGRGDIAMQIGLPAALEELGESFEFTNGKSVSPETFAKDLEKRGPTYVKLGQLLSTRADLLPPAYLDALSRLQDHVAPVPVESIHEIIAEDLGLRVSHGFAELEPTPLAAASLGQVHRAKLRDGQDVVVKVQRPDIRSRIIKDLEAMGELAEFLDMHTDFGRRMGLTDIVESLHDSMLRELDYREEAENALELLGNLAQFEAVRIPKPVESYVSSRVITMEYVPGVKITDLSPTVLLELDRQYLADELFCVYLHQVLVDGCFHADPHPGNLLLTPERQIAIMDFGMVTRVPPEMQKRLTKLLLAICDGYGEEAARIAIQMGIPREDFQEPEFIGRIAQLVASNHKKSVGQLQAGRIVMDIQGAAGDCALRVPRELTMLGKTLLNLDRVVSTLDPSFDPNEALRRRAAEILQRQAKNRISLSSLYNAALDTAEFAQHLPSRANRVSELIANNELRVQVDAIDEHRLMSGMQKIANRITSGLVLAALIIGASLLMHLESSLTLFGLPAIALVFFLIAATLGLVLVFRAMFSDESHNPRKL